MLFFSQILCWVYSTRKVNISSRTDVMKEETDPTIRWCWSVAVMDRFWFKQKENIFRSWQILDAQSLTFSNFGNVFSTICHHFWTSSTNFIVFTFSTYEVDYFLWKIFKSWANINKHAVTRHRFDIWRFEILKFSTKNYLSLKLSSNFSYKLPETQHRSESFTIFQKVIQYNSMGEGQFLEEMS